MNGGPAGSSAWLPRVAAGLAIAGGLVLMAAAAMVVVSIGLRSPAVGGAGVPGDFELVQIATALAAFAFFPLAHALRGHIMVTSFTRWLPPRWQRLLDRLWEGLFAAVMAVVAWRLLLGGLDLVTNRTVTMVLGLPVGPVVLAASALAAMAAVVSLGQALGRGKA